MKKSILKSLKTIFLLLMSVIFTYIFTYIVGNLLIYVDFFPYLFGSLFILYIFYRLSLKAINRLIKSREPLVKVILVFFMTAILWFIYKRFVDYIVLSTNYSARNFGYLEERILSYVTFVGLILLFYKLLVKITDKKVA